MLGGGVPVDPIVWASAQGATVTDVDGNRFIDVTAGFAVAALGHASEAVCNAGVAMLRKPMVHAMGDAFSDASRVALLEELARFVPELPKGILGCSGADAVQAALKTAALKSGRPGVLAFSGGYHGLAHGALAPSAYKMADFRQPFAPSLGGHVHFHPYGSLPLPPLATATPPIGAVLVEPVQGRGGVRSASAAWLQALRAHCDAEVRRQRALSITRTMPSMIIFPCYMGPCPLHVRSSLHAPLSAFHRPSSSSWLARCL